MTISEETQKIMDVLYKAYGTDTGILFGISSSKVVGVIVQFTLDYIEGQEDKHLQRQLEGEDENNFRNQKEN